MSDTLKTRTERASLFLLRENLSDLHAYSENFDPDEIDRLVKAADLVSTSLKKLLSWVSDEAVVDQAPASSEQIDIMASSAFITAVLSGQVCQQCGGNLQSKRNANA